MNKKVCILSIDGGGIRGIIPATILKHMESCLQSKSGNPDVRLADYFDLMAGTSTGGILVCAYLSPGFTPSRPKFSAADALNLYKLRGDKIFDVALWQKIVSGFGTFDEKYSQEEIEKALSDYFGDTLLSELLKPCLITAYDIEKRKGHFFTSYNAVTDIRNFKVRDVARATSAAPTYFEAASVKSLYGANYSLIDGGVFANNPALCAYAEARTMNFANKGKLFPSAKDMLIISLGTGEVKKPYLYDKAKNWGSISWIKPVIDIMMSGNSETVDYQLKKIYDTLMDADKNCYKRLQVDLSKTKAKSDMDLATPENIALLEDAGKHFIADHEDELEHIAKILIENN